MRIINKRGMIQSIISRLQCSNAKKTIIKMIEKINLDFATEGEIYAITGNRKYTNIVCDECDKEVDSVVVLNESPISEECDLSVYVCKTCILSASLLFLGDQPHARMSSKSGGNNASAM